jgi:NAD(P)-dependent dehydrogenase (short-subunit alcohol dehydrogenase family)
MDAGGGLRHKPWNNNGRRRDQHQVMSDPHFHGKTALVTGGGAGIGRASALAFARRGANLMIADIDAAAAAETAQLARAAGAEAAWMGCDVTQEAAVAGLIRAALDRFGSLAFAHNNVGSSRGQRLEEMSEADYQYTIDVCFKSVFLCMRQEIPAMRAAGGGAIVNTASMAGVSTTDAANIVYAGAKAGVIHMTAYAARLAAKDHIRVNCIAPGLVATKIVSEMFTPAQQDGMAAAHQLFGRIIQPEEIAAAVVFLCSAEAAMITGIMVPVDGGLNAIR